ncbi:MAG: DUF1080 domain-containing protein [Alistipes sp.]|nr:DUF1080 domain-containing protein [Alistipes sp.]
MKKLTTLLALALAAVAAQAQGLKLEIHPDKVVGNITPLLYGAGMEDVNHEIYGGIYSQRIFGESFEEGILPEGFKGMSHYDSPVRMDGNAIQVYSETTAKIIDNTHSFADGWAEVEIRADAIADFNGELLLRVSDAKNGYDSFNGYEVTLTSRGVKFSVHRQDYKPLATSKRFEVSGFRWHKLRAEVEGSTFNIYLNGEKVLTYEHTDSPLNIGFAGVRSFNSNVSFRNLRVGYDGKSFDIPFTPTNDHAVSGMWDAYFTPQAQPAYALDTTTATTGEQSQVIENKASVGRVGVTNRSLNRWGIAVKKGQKFDGEIMLKGSAGKVWVALQSNDGKEYGRTEIKNISTDWGEHKFTLRSNTTDPDARFAIYVEGKGKIWADQAMLMLSKRDSYKGVPVRGDIAQCFKEQGLTMLRYGGSMVNAPDYKFAQMRGERSERQPYDGQWYHHSTNGFGIIEFVEFGSAMGYELSFAVNINDDPQVMAEMVEYFNGDTSTKWGAQRAKDGHPKPYGLKYIEIGNEETLFEMDTYAAYDYYIERFNILSEAMRKVDPSLEFIHSAWWRPELKDKMREVFLALDGKAAYWDFHPWVDDLGSARRVDGSLQEMERMFKEWNPETTMRCAILEENGSSHGIRRMLSHVIVQNAVRRAGDFVLTTCPANALEPYLQNDNGWNQGQIFFTPDKAWGMPPYHAQKLSSAHHQPLLIESVMVGRRSDTLDITATRSEDGREIVLHIVNLAKAPQSIALDFTTFGKIRKAEKWSISGEENAVNSPDEPARIAAQPQQVDFLGGECSLEPFSYTVVKVRR